MSVKIVEISDKVFTVNDKLVKADMDGNWIEKEELTPNEERVFKTHLKSKNLIQNWN